MRFGRSYHIKDKDIDEFLGIKKATVLKPPNADLA